jgi:hypothetical protein
MLGFFRNWRWKEQVKLATQNSLACRFLFAFEQNAIEAGLKPASTFKSTLETELETAEGYLSDLSRREPLPTMIANDALDMNRELRGMYDAVLQGRIAFASRFGNASERLLPFDQMFTPNVGWKIYLKHFAEREEEHSQTNRVTPSKNPKPETCSPVATSIYQQASKEEREPVTAELAAILKKRRQARQVAADEGAREPAPNTSAAFEYATTALMSDAYPHQAKAELAEKFGLSNEDAAEIVRAAKNKIMQEMESRNPEAFRKLGLSSYTAQANAAEPYLDDLVDRGRMAGYDATKLREVFKNVGPEQMRRLETETAKILALQNQLNEANSRPQSFETAHEPKGTWTVHVDDNFHYMEEEERYLLGSFDSYDAAMAACQRIVDDFLENNDAMSAHELFKSYVSFGEDPWIRGPHPDPTRPPFSARDYARRRCFELRP